MARTLNPQLFGSIESSVVKVDASTQAQVRKMRELESQFEIVNQKIDKWVQILEGKIQQLHTNQKNLSEQIKNMADGFSGQQASILSKLTERRGVEAKTQEIIDRHNQLVQNFNVRMTHVQKVTNEQEMKLMTYQATYDEILREIRALKK